MLLRKNDVKLMLFIILSFATSYFFNIEYCVISALTLIISGVICYIYYLRKENNIANTPGLFSLVWFFSIGLACFRFVAYQVPWNIKTWIVLAIFPVCFLSSYTYFKPYNKKRQVIVQDFRGHLSPLMIITFLLIVLISFTIEIMCEGFLPILSHDPTAYFKFGVSGLHYLTVSGLIPISLSLLYLKKNKTHNNYRCLIIFLDVIVFIIPILIVSRQLFMMQCAVILFTLIPKEYDKKQLYICLGIILLMIASWFMITKFRNLSDSYLDYTYKLSDKENIRAPLKYKENMNVNELKRREETFNKLYSHEDFSNNYGILDGTTGLFYMYLSFNYDNLNYKIIDLDLNNEFMLGKQSLYPILDVLRLRDIVPKLANDNLIKEFNSYPIVLESYADFKIIGIVLFAIAIGSITKYLSIQSNEYSLVLESILKYNFLICFFSNMFTSTTVFVYILLIMIFMMLSYKNKELKKVWEKI